MITNHWSNGEYYISADKSLLNIPYIHHYLCFQSYWAEGRAYETVDQSIQNSTCFGVYIHGKQIGFARVISDKATFGYLADVFIDEQYRGLGLSKWLMKVILDYPEFQNFHNWLLLTKDAQGLYAQFGFSVYPNPERVMRKSSIG